MQRQHAHRGGERVAQHPLGAPDLRLAREEGEHVAGFPVERVAHRAGDRLLDAVLRPARPPARLDRVRPPLARHDGRRPQQPRDGGAVERGRHDEEAQVVAQQLARLQRERQPQIRLQAALVELVEDHEPDALERRVLVQHPREHALGHHLDARARRDARVEAHAVAHRVADALAEGARHPVRGGAGGEAPRLEHHDRAAAEPRLVEQGERHARRLAGAGRRLEHGGGAAAQGVAQRGQGVVDRERTVEAHRAQASAGGRTPAPALRAPTAPAYQSAMPRDGRRAADEPPRTPDGRYIVVRGRLWRATDPRLSDEERGRHTAALMAARREVGVALRAGDAARLRAARQAVDAAKVALGERGPVWWDDGAPDLNRRLVRNTPYAEWFASR